MSAPFQRLEKLNTKECLWLYVLRILCDKPLHAYVLRNEIKKKYGFLPGTVTAYKVLYLLKKDGFVRKTRKGRAVVYTITSKGKKELQRAVDFYKERIKFLEVNK